MKKYKLGERYIIHSYKHDGNIHRAWNEAVLLEDNDDYMVFGNEKTKVTESDGRTWKTKEPAIIYFFKDNWYNVIGQYKKDGIYYYCNIASPFVIDEKTIKYIDYDLDLRVFPDGALKVLDRGEYNYHKSKMNYSNDIDKILKYELSNLIELARNKKGPFVKEKLENYYQMYKAYKTKIVK